MSDILDWTHVVSEIGESGLTIEREADVAERAAVATALEIEGCNRLSARYRIEVRPGGLFTVRGNLDAEVVQSCVVTTDPVIQRIEEPIEIEFAPKARIAAPEAGELEVLGPEEPEPIENNRLAIGRVVYEIVATALDPYPRADNAILEEGEGQSAPRDSKANPFAALADWKPKPK